MSDTKDKNQLAALGVFIAIGLIGAGYFIGNTLYKSRVSVNVATVKGLSEREVKSDLAVWNISFTMEAPEIEEAYASADEKKKIAEEFLLKNGFDKDEFSFSNSVYIAEFRDTSAELKERKFQVTTFIDLRTENVDKVNEVRQKMGELIEKGLALSNSQPSFLFTKLNDVKPEMLKEATKNARMAAEEFAKDAGTKVGTIQSASQGSFAITAPEGADNYSLTDQTSLTKKVRVVTTISFYLEN